MSSEQFEREAPTPNNSPENKLRAVDPWSAWAATCAAPPPSLYHYTSARAMHKILTNRSVWATSLRHMNDARELSYGADLVRVQVREAIKQAGDDCPRAFSEGMPNALDPFRQTYDAYAFCLSEAQNDLPQWRAYSNNGRGYSLGFSHNIDHDLDNELGEVRLGKVVYARDEQVEIIDSVVAKAIDLARNAPNDTAQRQVRHSLRQVMGELIPFLKDPAFATEREWRLVALRVRPLVNDEHGAADDDGDPRGIQFRERNGRIFPYLELHTPPGPEDRGALALAPLSVTEIWAGPQVQETEPPALRLLKAAHGLDVALKFSRIPLLD